jgi:hypothetical protein
MSMAWLKLPKNQREVVGITHKKTKSVVMTALTLDYRINGYTYIFVEVNPGTDSCGYSQAKDDHFF